MSSSDPLRRELGAFLRATRESTAPADVGLNTETRRRTPGLRREEVAALSGVSISWYTWLEQGRVAVSRHVLDAVCRVLLMDPVGRRHAFELAGFHHDTATSGGGEHLQPLIDSWPTTLALLLDRRMDIVGANAGYRATVLDPSTIPPARRNLLLLLVGELDGAVAEWQSLVRGLHGQFRAGTDRLPGDVRVRAIRRLLAAERPDLAHWWRCRSVADFTPTTVSIRGTTMTLSMLRPTGAADVSVLAHTLG